MSIGSTRCQTGMDLAKPVGQNSSLGPSVSTDPSKYLLTNVCFSNSMSVAFLSSEVPTYNLHILFLQSLAEDSIQGNRGQLFC